MTVTNLSSGILYRGTKKKFMRTGIRVDLEALRMKRHMSVVTVTGLVLEEEVQYTNQIVDNMVITGEALLVLR